MQERAYDVREAAEQFAKPAVAVRGLEAQAVFGLNEGLKRLSLDLAACRPMDYPPSHESRTGV